MDQMIGKLADVDDGRPLEQDAMEGVDEDEWVWFWSFYAYLGIAMEYCLSVFYAWS